LAHSAFCTWITRMIDPAASAWTWSAICEALDTSKHRLQMNRACAASRWNPSLGPQPFASRPVCWNLQRKDINPGPLEGWRSSGYHVSCSQSRALGRSSSLPWYTPYARQDRGYVAVAAMLFRESISIQRLDISGDRLHRRRFLGA
jgi:hypothetical protein